MTKNQIHKALVSFGQMMEGLNATTLIDSLIPLHIKNIEIHHPKIGKNLSGFKILHLTDLHFDGSDRLVHRLADKVSGLSVGMVVMTGDYHKGNKQSCDCKRLAHQLETVLKGITTRHGVFATLGNHDPDRLQAALADKGICVLHDSIVDISLYDQDKYHVDAEQSQILTLDDQVAASSFLRIAGIDYETCKKHVRSINLPYADPDQFSIVLAHTPRAAHAMAVHCYDLYLTGHTHGGQIRSFVDIHTVEAERVRAFGPWCEEQMIGYTSSGIGTSSYPVRVESQAEVTLFTLIAA
ncbi:MAG: metallophosphoesterase [Alphaproteobacteria bacterium]|nr:metallophosphoesterase [Alphaproteobacteria bacterium]